MGIINKIFGSKKKEKKNHRLMNAIRLENPELSDEEVQKLVVERENELKEVNSRSSKGDIGVKTKRNSFDPDAKKKYRELKKQRALAAKKKREEDERLIEAENKKRQEELELRKREQEVKLAHEREIQKINQEKKEEEAARRREEKEREAEKNLGNEERDVFEDFFAPISRGDNIEVEVVGKEKDIYFCQAVSNGQEILLPEIELEGHKIEIGQKIAVKIYKKYAGDLFASRRRLLNEEKIHRQMSEINDTEVVNGVVTGFKRFNFEVTLTNGLKGNVYIKNMDTKFIEDGELYLGKSFNFKIIDRDEGNHNAQFELSRRELLFDEMLETVKEIEIGEEIVVDEIKWNKGGLNFSYKKINGFVPMRELSHSYLQSPEEAELVVKPPLKIKIKEVKVQGNKVDLIGSVKDLEEDPWSRLESKYKVGDKISGKISRIERYGIFLPIDFGINGLMHQSVMLDAMRKAKVGDMIDSVIEKIDVDKKQINLVPFLEKVEDEK